MTAGGAVTVAAGLVSEEEASDPLGDETLDAPLTFSDGSLTAVAAGWKDAIADPAKAIESLVERNPAADAALEQRRLQLAIDANVLTDAVAANGMGAVDAARMEAALAQLAETYTFQNAPDASLYFTDAYLPAADARKLK